MFTKSVRCYDVNPKFLANVSCRLKATRQVPSGLTQIKVDAINIVEAFVRLTLFYRYLLDFTVNACEICKQANALMKNPVIKIVATGLKDVFPRLFDGCPYNVSYSS